MDPPNRPLRLGFVSARLAGTDGVSLEIDKWIHILERLGHRCTFIGGPCDRPLEEQFQIPEADFRHPEIEELQEQCFGRFTRDASLADGIRHVAGRIKAQLHEAVSTQRVDVLVVQNALTLPMNVPLGVAITEFLIETGMPCIAHHHDFYWERDRYLVNCVGDFLAESFPPPLTRIQHVVLNSVAGREFSRRTGLPYSVIPNVMNFAHGPPPLDDFALELRADFGIEPTEYLVLQPTRIVSRKGIEHSLELMRRLDEPRARFLISHSEEDDRKGYADRIRALADLLGVEILFGEPRISDRRVIAEGDDKRYSIWDVYPQADFITYPSSYEGFGNAFLEAVYFKKPIFCNRYTIFRTDIEPCGFQAIVMEGFLQEEVVQQARQVLRDEEARQKMVDHNYELGRRFFSFERAEEELRMLLARPHICGA